jgi:predicted NBD/HSP70 family sugar kinase
MKHIGPSSENTRRAILDLIRSGGVVSRIDLVERSGLTATTITRIVKILLAEDLVIETGLGGSTGGKRRTLLELNAGSRYAVGLSLDDARLNYVVTDLAGNSVGRMVTAGLGDTYPPTVIERIREELDALLERLDIRRADVVGVGVAAAGRLDATGGVLRASTEATKWEDFAVQEALAAASGLTVILENDSACAALGEFWAGRIPATQDFATLYMATGIGCGIVIDGKIYGGASSNAGEIGHMVVDVNGPACWCGSSGCLEVLAAPHSVVRRAMGNAALVESLGLSGAVTEVRRDFALVARAAVQGDKACLDLIEESANYLAVAIVSLTNLMDLDRLHLAGPSLADAGSIYYRIIRERVENVAFMREVHPVRVELSEMGIESAALGAAAVMLQSTLTSRRTRRGADPPAGASESAQAVYAVPAT